MNIKQQIVNEIELRKLLRGNTKTTYKKIAKETGVSYNSILKWVKDNNKTITLRSLEKIADNLGKRFIMVDKEI